MKDASLPFEIKLPCFEGPFDLLLFFIARDDIDIHDIPIAHITHEYLTYIQQMEALNVSLAAEFMWVAATLLRLKARALLPLSTPALDEEEDAQQDLVTHLLVYKKYKTLAEKLQTLALQRETQHARACRPQEIEQLRNTYALEIKLQALCPSTLYHAYLRLVTKAQLRAEYLPPPVLRSFSYTVAQQKKYLLRQITRRTRLSFLEMVKEQPEKTLLIFKILALLDLWHTGKVQVHVGPGYNHFWIEAIST